MSKAPTRIQQKNRSTILAAGLDVFSKFGFRGSTLDQIATAAGLSKPNLLYYFESKEAIYTVILERLLETWLDPLLALDPSGDATEEILAYTMRKLEMSQMYPRESRLFANEIIQGAPHLIEHLRGSLKALVDEKALVLQNWSDKGDIAKLDPYHLIFSIWAMTQHYADFDVQLKAILTTEDVFPDARSHLEAVVRSMLRPA